MVQQGHELPTEAIQVHAAICVMEDAFLSEPFKGRRMDYLVCHFNDTVAYVKGPQI